MPTIIIQSYAKRPVTVLGDYPFYRSSGDNSGYPGTWFPFAGFSPFPEFIGIPLFIKPSLMVRHTLEQGLLTRYPRPFYDFVSRLRHCTGNLLIRFGNIETLILSSLLGGGFWNQPIGNKIKTFLTQHYNDYVMSIESHYRQAIDEINHYPQQLISEIPFETKEERLLANRFLESVGAKFRWIDLATLSTGAKSVEMPDISFEIDHKKIISQELEKKPTKLSVRQQLFQFAGSLFNSKYTRESCEPKDTHQKTTGTQL